MHGPRQLRSVLGSNQSHTRNFFMDDYLDSVNSPQKDLNRSKELLHLLHLGGFKLNKFLSNVPNLADQIDGSPQSTEPKVIAGFREESLHVLGLKWHHNNDTLVVNQVPPIQ